MGWPMEFLVGTTPVAVKLTAAMFWLLKVCGELDGLNEYPVLGGVIV
jgi:hypothetical protein